MTIQQVNDSDYEAGMDEAELTEIAGGNGGGDLDTLREEAENLKH